MNKLIPISPCSSSPGEWEPSLIPHGYRRPHLVNTDGALRIRCGRSGSFHEFHFVTHLGGMVHQGGYLPIIRSDEGGTFLVQDPSDMLLSAFEEAKAANP